MNLADQDILSFLPQRSPFVMIDNLLVATEALITTTFTVREGHELVKERNFTEAGLVENMAQTAASGTGALATTKGKAPPVGFIGGLKNLKIKKLPSIGETIQTEVIFVHQVLNAHIVQAAVMLNGEEIAHCELKIFLQIPS